MERDIVIIGGGPAAMSAAIYAARAELKVCLVERAVVGGQSALTHDIANYPGFPDGIDGPDLADRMRQQAEKFGTEFIQDEAQGVERNLAGSFCVKLNSDTICAPVVIIATGADPRKLEVPGEYEFRGRGVSYCGTCDGPFFRGKRVAVVGGGDSALKESLHIAKFASAVTIIHRREEFRAEKIHQREIAANSKIKTRMNTAVKEIRGGKKVESMLVEDTVTGEQSVFETDGVFIFVGAKPNTHFLCPLLPADCGGHVATDADMMTAVPGIFAIGDVRKHSYRQIATAVGEGATAAIAAEHFLLDMRR